MCVSVCVCVGVCVCGGGFRGIDLSLHAHIQTPRIPPPKTKKYAKTNYTEHPISYEISMHEECHIYKDSLNLDLYVKKNLFLFFYTFVTHIEKVRDSVLNRALKNIKMYQIIKMFYFMISFARPHTHNLCVSVCVCVCVLTCTVCCLLRQLGSPWNLLLLPHYSEHTHPLPRPPSCVSQHTHTHPLPRPPSCVSQHTLICL